MRADPGRRRGRRWAFYPAPWLVAAPVVAFAGTVGSWPLAVAAALGALYLTRHVYRPPRP
jgi:hypothetical protein